MKLVLKEKISQMFKPKFKFYPWIIKVKGIVDKAVKESAMEKVLKELNTTWTSMAFETEPHTRTKIPLLKPSDELIETLEDNQVRNARQIFRCRGV